MHETKYSPTDIVLKLSLGAVAKGLPSKNFAAKMNDGPKDCTQENMG